MAPDRGWPLARAAALWLLAACAGALRLKEPLCTVRSPAGASYTLHADSSLAGPHQRLLRIEAPGSAPLSLQAACRGSRNRSCLAARGARPAADGCADCPCLQDTAKPLIEPHEREFLRFMQASFATGKSLETLHIGIGSGSLVAHMTELYPQSLHSLVEPDAARTALSRTYLGSRWHVLHQEPYQPALERILWNASNYGRYDFVIVDAADQKELGSAAFAEAAYAATREGGCLMARIAVPALRAQAQRALDGVFDRGLPSCPLITRKPEGNYWCKGSVEPACPGGELEAVSTYGLSRGVPFKGKLPFQYAGSIRKRFPCKDPAVADRCIRLPPGNKVKAILAGTLHMDPVNPAVMREIKGLFEKSRQEWRPSSGEESAVIIWDARKADSENFCKNEDATNFAKFQQLGIKSFYHMFLWDLFETKNSSETYYLHHRDVDICDLAQRLRTDILHTGPKNHLDEVGLTKMMRDARTVYFVGGDTWYLMRAFRKSALTWRIFEQVQSGHCIYMGASASSLISGHNMDLSTKGKSEILCTTGMGEPTNHWRPPSIPSSPDNSVGYWSPCKTADVAGLGSIIFGNAPGFHLAIKPHYLPQGKTYEACNRFLRGYGRGYALLKLSGARADQADGLVIKNGEMFYIDSAA